MDKRELVQLVAEKLEIWKMPERHREEILSYLEGEREETKYLPSVNARVYYYDLVDILTSRFPSEECGETAKRAYRMISRMSESAFLQHAMWNQHALREFSAAQLEESMVKRYSSRKIEDLLNGYPWRYGETLKTVKKEMYGPSKGRNGLSELYPFYACMAEQWIREDQERDEASLVTLTLLILGIFWHTEETKRKQYLQETNVLLMRMLKFLILKSKRKKNDILDFWTEPSCSLYEDTEASCLFLPRERLSQVLLGASRVLKEFSDAFLDIEKALWILEKPAMSYSICHMPFARLYLEVKDMELPAYARVSLAAEGIFLEDFKKTGKNNAKILRECYQLDRQTFWEVWQEARDSGDRKALSMLAVVYGKWNPLLKKGEMGSMISGHGEEDREFAASKADETFLGYLDTNQKKHGIVFRYKGKEVKASYLYQKFHSLKKDTKLELSGKGDFLEDAWIGAALLYPISGAAKEFFAFGFQTVYQMRKNHSNQYAARIQGENSLRFFISAWMSAGVIHGIQEAAAKEGQAGLFKELAGQVGILTVLDAYMLGGAGAEQEGFLLFAKQHLDLVEEVYEQALATESHSIIPYVDLFFRKDIGLPAGLLGKTMEHKLKTVVNYVEEFVAGKEETMRAEVEAMSTSKNRNAREAALRLMKKWDEEKIAERFRKSQDAKQLAINIRDLCEPKADGKGKTVKKKGKEPAGPYAKLLAEQPVRLAGSEELADPVLLHYYFSEYMLLKEVKVLQPCEEIRKYLNNGDFKALWREIYGQWLEDRADTKLKNVLMPYVIGADEGDILDLKKQIDQWTENARGMLAAFAVSVMALHGSDLSLVLINSMSKKYKNKQVKQAASGAMERAAALLSITKEELEDRILPDFGFDKNREKLFHFGTRSFKGILTSELTIDLYDVTGKRLKNMPKPGAKDDPELATKTAAEFKILKKQLKTVVAAQKNRLEEAVITGRSWDQVKWERLFVDNPVMNVFAIGLIWEERDREGNILGTFRYMEDGSFNSSEEDEYELSGNSRIALLHPLDVPEDVVHTWREQLEDYEIMQPFPQLNMPVYILSEEEASQETISRFEGNRVYFGTIRGVMEKYDWKKTSIIDGGGYDGYYYEEAASGIGVQILFQYLYVGMANDEEVTLNVMQFYRAGTIEYGSYTYDEVTEENRLLPKEVPDKLVSFACMIGDLLAKKAI